MDRNKEAGTEQRETGASLNNVRYILENSYFDINVFIESLTKDSASSYVFFGDVQKNIYYVSDNMRDKFGFAHNTVEDLLGEWEKRIFCEEGKQYFRQNIQLMFKNRESNHDLRYRVVDKDGKMIWIRCFGLLQWNEDKTKPLFFSGRINTQDNRYYIEPVSNLPGGSVFLRHLEHIRSVGPRMPVVGFCLNHMEKINALQGRTYGDRLIRDVSCELQKSMLHNWAFYKLDGMRFAAVAKEENLNIQQEIDGMRTVIYDNYVRMGVPLEQNCAFAVMEYPMENLTPIDFQENLITMIRYARMHTEIDYAVNGDTNIIQSQIVANSEMLLYQNVKDGMQDFRPVVQPIVSAQTGRILGGETLLRWRLGSKDVSPAVFIPVLEKSPLIHTVGRWIFEQAVRICSGLVKTHPRFYLNVNVSLQQLNDIGLMEYMGSCLQRYGLTGEHICVELTESCMDQEPDKLITFVEGCEALGIKIALDDFGSGYSSMRVLMKYPSKVIKLDRSLLLEMIESEDKLNFISSIVFACHKFGKRVCIEGVETEKQRKMALEAGCDMIQGFYFYKPQEIDSLQSIMDAQTVDVS